MLETIAGPDAMQHELHRPQFHATPPRNWMNDPNGLVFHEGEYHFFYQHNPHGDTWGHMSWAHAVSRDLLRWEHLPLALAEEDGVMIFSGSAVVDVRNTSGFGAEGRPPLVALYTGHRTEPPLQSQHLAWSTDRGRTWTKYAGNPVLDIGETEFRDPKVFWHEPTQRWIMVVALAVQRRLSFYASPDLKQWTKRGDFGPAGSVEGIWECPDLFPLAVDGDPAKTKWVLLLNVNPGAPAGGSGCQYFVGEFDGTQFVADPPPPGEGGARWVDFGADFYAAVTWSDIPADDGRRIALGWMSNWQYAGKVPTAPWRGAMTLPRVLALRSAPGGPRLYQAPVRELERLRRDVPRTFRLGTFRDAAAWLDRQPGLPALLDVELALAGVGPGTRVTLALHTGADERTTIVCDGGRGTLALDRSRSGATDFEPSFAAVHEAPLRVVEGVVRLRVVLDASSIEVFAQGGETVLTDLIFPGAGRRRFSLSAEGRPPTAARIAIHSLATEP